MYLKRGKDASSAARMITISAERMFWRKNGTAAAAQSNLVSTDPSCPAQSEPHNRSESRVGTAGGFLS